jgi:hypothetical protein
MEGCVTCREYINISYKDESLSVLVVASSRNDNRLLVEESSCSSDATRTRAEERSAFVEESSEKFTITTDPPSGGCMRRVLFDDNTPMKDPAFGGALDAFVTTRKATRQRTAAFIVDIGQNGASESSA